MLCRTAWILRPWPVYLSIVTNSTDTYGSFTQVLHCVSLHGTALCQFARYCTVSVCTALHCGSLHSTALWQFARYSVLQRHYINAPYTGFHPHRGKCVYQSMHALKQSVSVCHCADFYETCFYCTTFCEELLYRILWKSDKRTVADTAAQTIWRTDGHCRHMGHYSLSFYFAKKF